MPITSDTPPTRRLLAATLRAGKVRRVRRDRVLSYGALYAPGRAAGRRDWARRCRRSASCRAFGSEPCWRSHLRSSARRHEVPQRSGLAASCAPATLRRRSARSAVTGARPGTTLPVHAEVQHDAQVGLVPEHPGSPVPLLLTDVGGRMMSGSGMAMLPMLLMIEPFHAASSDCGPARGAAVAGNGLRVEVAERRHLVLEHVDVDRAVAEVLVLAAAVDAPPDETCTVVDAGAGCRRW